MLEVHSGLIVWTIITFVLLLFVLRKFAWKPLLDSLDRREGHVRSSIEQAERARQEAERLLEEHQRQLAAAGQESHRILNESRAMAEKLKDEIVEKANQQSRKLLEQAHQQIEREKDAALAKLRGEVASLAISAAQKILDETLNEERHRKIVDSYLDSLQRN